MIHADAVLLHQASGRARNSCACAAAFCNTHARFGGQARHVCAAPTPPFLNLQTCDTDVSRTPWGIPSLLFGTPAGLLSPGNATYSDVVLCCGGTLDFRWSVSFAIAPSQCEKEQLQYKWPRCNCGQPQMRCSLKMPS